MSHRLLNYVNRLSPELWAWLALYLVSFVLRIVQCEGACIADEELHTPTAAAWLAGTFELWRLPDLQYTDHCGGCTAETLLVLPFFWLLGPGAAIWKLVPLGFGLLLLALTWTLAERGAGLTAARVAALAVVFAPTWAGANSVVAFGGHFEVMVLVLAALLAWDRLLEQGRGALLTGLLLGLAFWFDYAAAFALPVLLGGVALRRRRAILPVLGGAVVGMAPWVLTRLSSGRSAQRPWLNVYGRSPGELAADGPTVLRRLGGLVGPDLWVSTWFPTLPADAAVPGFVSVAVAVVAVVAALLFGLLWKRRLVATFGLLVLSYAVVFLLFAPAGMEREDGSQLTANAMRYHLPLVPLVALCLGFLATLRPWTRWGVVVLGPGLGLALRLAEIEPAGWNLQALHLRAVDLQTVADRIPVPGTESGWMQAPGVDAVGVLEAAMARAPEHGTAREISLYAVGYEVLGPILTEDDLQGTADRSLSARALEAAGTLDEADRRALLGGAALHLERFGGWREPVALPTPPRPWTALLQQVPGVAGFELAREVLLLEFASPTSGLLRQLEEGASPFEGEPNRVSGTWHPAVAWTAGYAAATWAEEDHRTAEGRAARIVGLASALDDQLRGTFLGGAGERLGERLGERGEGELQAWSAADRKALLAGWSRGLARSSW